MDHMHLETGYGRYSSPSGHYHITSSGDVIRLHNYDALYINDTNPYQSPGAYVWKTFSGGHPSPTPSGKKYHFNWVLYKYKERTMNKL